MKRQNQIGQAFKSVRLALGLTQEDFVQESGRTYISELERGLKNPTLQKVDELSSRMGIHPLTLIALSYASKELVATQRDKVAGVDKILELVQSEIEGLLSRKG